MPVNNISVITFVGSSVTEYKNKYINENKIK